MNVKNKKQKKTIKAGVIGLISGAVLLLPTLAQAESYTVKSGDTLSSIAAAHQTTVDQLAQKNKISNINLISIGQVLELDAAAEQESAPQAAAEPAESSTFNATAGLSAEDAAAKEWIAQKESGGSYTAQNGQYYGRYQLTITYLNGDLSAENQEKTADAYVAGRYGSWSTAMNFWLANGWY